MQTDIIGVTIGILGIVIGVFVASYFYKKSIRVKEPVYSIKSNNLISDSTSKLSNLNISYKKQKVQNLTISKILFYNRGGETVRKQDIKTALPIKIEGRNFDADIELLDVSIIGFNNYSSRMDVRLHEGKAFALIDFDYLDKNQGAVIQVIHTGQSSEDIAITGDVIGVDKLIEFPSDKIRTQEQGKSAIKSLLISIFAFLMTIAAVFLIVFLASFFISSDSTMRANLRILSIIFMLAVIGGISSKLMTTTFDSGTILTRVVLPKGLEKFLE